MYSSRYLTLKNFIFRISTISTDTHKRQAQSKVTEVYDSMSGDHDDVHCLLLQYVKEVPIIFSIVSLVTAFHDKTIINKFCN